MRKNIYLKWINEAIKELKKFQDFDKNSETYGCLYYPYWKLKQKKHINARWQEAALTFAWYYNKTNKIEYKERAIAAVDFWTKTQNRDGSFTELIRYERSFAATAFTLSAILKTIQLIGYNKRWEKALKNTGDWLIKNDETIMINQEAVAALSLLQLYNLTKNQKYKQAAENKLNLVLNNQTEQGNYLEQKGYDLGYSTLTLSLLAQYYQMNKNKEILQSAKRFINLASNPPLKNNIRDSNWIIIDGFEIFYKIPKTKQCIKNFIETTDIKHMPNDRHICTESHRICSAYDNIKINIKHEEPTIFFKNPEAKYSKLLNPLRIIGIHKLRPIKYSK